MDDRIAARLRAQEGALREVVAECARARDRVFALKDATGWHGAAAEAYRHAGDVLESELTAAHTLLVRALNDTAHGVPVDCAASGGARSVG